MQHPTDTSTGTSAAYSNIVEQYASREQEQRQQREQQNGGSVWRPQSPLAAQLHSLKQQAAITLGTFVEDVARLGVPREAIEEIVRTAFQNGQQQLQQALQGGGVQAQAPQPR